VTAGDGNGDDDDGGEPRRRLQRRQTRTNDERVMNHWNTLRTSKPSGSNETHMSTGEAPPTAPQCGHTERLKYYIIIIILLFSYYNDNNILFFLSICYAVFRRILQLQMEKHKENSSTARHTSATWKTRISYLLYFVWSFWSLDKNRDRNEWRFIINSSAVVPKMENNTVVETQIPK